jgi:hypothetical protein
VDGGGAVKGARVTKTRLSDAMVTRLTGSALVALKRKTRRSEAVAMAGVVKDATVVLPPVMTTAGPAICVQATLEMVVPTLLPVPGVATPVSGTEIPRATGLGLFADACV